MTRLLRYIAHREAPGLTLDFVVITLGAALAVEMLERALFGLA